jgi:hypothetical protein
MRSPNVLIITREENIFDITNGIRDNTHCPIECWVLEVVPSLPRLVSFSGMYPKYYKNYTR